jgi:hypothetical protein
MQAERKSSRKAYDALSFLYTGFSLTWPQAGRKGESDLSVLLRTATICCLDSQMDKHVQYSWADGFYSLIAFIWVTYNKNLSCTGTWKIIKPLPIHSPLFLMVCSTHRRLNVCSHFISLKLNDSLLRSLCSWMESLSIIIDVDVRKMDKYMSTTKIKKSHKLLIYLYAMFS